MLFLWSTIVVCRDLVKSLLLSYLSAPLAKRDEALHPIAKIFGFQANELAKVSFLYCLNRFVDLCFGKVWLY